MSNILLRIAQFSFKLKDGLELPKVVFVAG